MPSSYLWQWVSIHHNRCMRWRWGDRKCKVGSRCCCNFMGKNQSWVKWKVTRCLWSDLEHQEVFQCLVSVWALLSPTISISTTLQISISSSNSLESWAYTSSLYSTPISFSFCCTCGVSSSIASISTSFYLPLAPFCCISNLLQHWTLQITYNYCCYILAKNVLSFDYKNVNNRNLFVKAQ